MQKKYYTAKIVYSMKFISDVNIHQVSFLTWSRWLRIFCGIKTLEQTILSE